jgi:uncharacterized protein YodC (DUF2158 family)
MEMDLAFKPGDVVQLNSGGPKMTVEAVQSDGMLRCVWFHEDGKRDNGVFAQVALRAAKTKIESGLPWRARICAGSVCWALLATIFSA